MYNARIHNQRPVRTGRSKRRKIFTALLLFALLCFLKVWQSVNVESQYRRNGRLRDQLKAIKNENALLMAEVEVLRAGDRICDIAAKDLNLKKIPIINLKEKSTIEKITEQLEKLQR